MRVLLAVVIGLAACPVHATDVIVSGIEGVFVWTADGAMFRKADVVLSNAQHNAGGASADLDGDGDRDWLGVRFDTNALRQVWLGRKGRFRLAYEFGGDAPAWGVALGDLDGDGDADAYVSTSGGDSGCPADEVWLNDGAARFELAQRVGADCSSNAVLVDVDADGDLDVATANAAADADGFPNAPAPMRVWRNDGHAHFTDSGQALGRQVARDVAAGDVDRDGDPDLVLAARGGITVWFNDGRGAYADSGSRLGTATTFGIALADLDGDGDLDAFAANAHFAGATVWLNDGAGAYADSGQKLGELLALDVALADVDSDGDVDAVLANRNSATDHDGADTEIWLNDGKAKFARGPTLGRGRARKVVITNAMTPVRSERGSDGSRD